MKNWERIVNEETSPTADERLLVQIELLLGPKREALESTNLAVRFFQRRSFLNYFGAVAILSLVFVPFLWRHVLSARFKAKMEKLRAHSIERPLDKNSADGEGAQAHTKK